MPRNLPLICEFIALFVLAPVAVAVFLPSRAMFPALMVMTLVGVLLLHQSRNFHWRDLWRGWDAVRPVPVLLFGAVTALAGLLVTLLVVPESFLRLPRANIGLWLMVMLVYPLLSALPQEVVFRPLFFHRYAAILPKGRGALVLNAALFALAHLMYWHWIVAALTFAGGLVFAWAYRDRGSFPLAVILHGVAGNILFTLGAGTLFFSGAVTRPF